MIEIPTKCPCCESELVEKNFLLYCENNLCSAKIEGKLINFAKAMDIKGLGPATVAKLPITTIPELYTLTLENLILITGSEKVGTKLYEAVRNSLTTASLSNIINSFGVPLVGKTISEKITPYISKISDITEKVCRDAKIGPKATSNLLSFLDTEYHEDGWGEIPFDPVTTKKSTATGDTVCITGKLTSYATKAEAEKVLEARGFKVSKTLTKSVTILINESGIESQKTTDARTRGVQIITNIKLFLGEIN